MEFDGVVVLKTGTGALRRWVLVALRLRLDGKREIIDFRLVAGESATEWEKFLADLYRRGLAGEGLDMICVDGGAGLLAGLPSVFHSIPVQRCRQDAGTSSIRFAEPISPRPNGPCTRS
jgi:transposase-like protein